LSEPDFLPGVAVDRVISALRAAGGKEIESGKFANPESSAALAVNAFGWFLERPELLPPFPGLENIDWPAESVEVERCLRFPWSGGRHPWLDAVVETASHLIGVESKRFEPYRDRKLVSLSSAYDRPVWGDGMGPYEKLRDDLRTGECRYEFLDAAQLLKHAFGLVTQGRLLGKQPVLLYLFAEPAERGGRTISEQIFQDHRAEIADFANRVAGATVRFAACSYGEWLARFVGEAACHGEAVRIRFAP
jgi:hypothetical protein